MLETSLPARQNSMSMTASEFKLSLQTMTVWEREAILQELSNEYVGIRREIARLGKVSDLMRRRLKLLRDVCKTNLRGTKTEEFVRYRLSVMIKEKSAPAGEPLDPDYWAVIDQRGRTTPDWWVYFKAGSTTVYLLKKRKDLQFQWSERKFMRTRDMATVALLLREPKVRLLYLKATFTNRSRKNVQTTDYAHYFFIRAADGSKADALPAEIDRWGTYKPRNKRQCGGATDMDGISKVREDSGPVQVDQGGAGDPGDIGHLLYRAAGGECEVEKDGCTEGAGGGSKGEKEQGIRGQPSSGGGSEGGGAGGGTDLCP